MMKDKLVTEDNNEVLIVLQTNDDNHLRKWKIIHGFHSMLGGLCLICASCMYFADIIRQYSLALTLGGWLFTLGSFFLLLADLQQWWYNRTGCCSDQEHFHSPPFQMNPTRTSKIEMISFVAACGSACYVVGSALFIPMFEKYVTVGNWLIMIGSAIIFACATWKISRTGYVNVDDPYDRHFHLTNIIKDISALCIDICAGFGGVFYFLGIFLSPSNYPTNDFDINRSAALYVTGGTFFFLASIFLLFRYFYIYHP